MHADAGEVRAAEFLERGGLEGIELEIDFEARQVFGRAARRSPVSRAMRMPLVFTIRCRMGRARSMSRIAKKSGWSVGSPPEI
jgi:hypothetical protein